MSKAKLEAISKMDLAQLQRLERKLVKQLGVVRLRKRILREEKEEETSCK